MAFKYGGKQRTTEDIVRRAKGGGNWDSYILPEVTVFKPREGENNVRILPPSWLTFDKSGKVVENEAYKRWGGHWDIRVFVHYGVGPDEATYLCLNKMNGETCPVCEARRTAEDDDERDQWRYSERAVCWVIDRDNEKAGPQVWPMPASLSRDIYNRSIDKKTGEPILIDDPEDGYDISFVREGADKRTKYTSVDVDREPSPIHESEKTQQRWEEYITEHPLPDTLQFYDEDYIKKILFGKASSRKRGEEDEADEKPRSSRRAKAEPEEDEVEETPRGRRRSAEPEDEEEDEPPARSSRRGRREEPEEEVSDRRGSGTRRGRRGGGDEEEEAEEPTSRRRSRRSEPDEEEEEEVEETPRGRRRGKDLDDEIPSEDEEKEETSTRSSKRGRRSEPEEEEESEDESPTRQAKRQLGRLKTRGR